MLGIKICCEIVLEKGDEVVIVGPVWPNIRSSVVLREAVINEVSLDFDKTWTLDLNKLLNAITDKTKLVFINSPNNPTGWMLNSSEQQIILDHVRKKNCWLLADEVYHRIVYQGNASPSFLSLSEPEDILLVVISFWEYLDMAVFTALRNQARSTIISAASGLVNSALGTGRGSPTNPSPSSPFSQSDVGFKLRNATGGRSDVGSKILQYPLDLTTDDQPHYILFVLKERQVKIKYLSAIVISAYRLQRLQPVLAVPVKYQEKRLLREQ